MNRMIAVLALLAALAAPARATPYARVFDPANIYQAAGCGFDTTGHSPAACTTDIGVVTHSTADGSIIPWAWQPLLPPEDWALSIGGGGDLKANSVINFSASVNVAPQLAALAFKAVDASSPQYLQDIKTFASGTGNARLRIGLGLYGAATKDGHFQSFAASFPGQGILDIFNRAKRVEVGLAWFYGKKP
jgi:hypothetical protein